MKEAKQVVYRFDGNEALTEFVDDLGGKIPIPNKGDIIFRQGRQWKVVHVTTERSGDPKRPIPKVTISSTSDLKLPIYP